MTANKYSGNSRNVDLQQLSEIYFILNNHEDEKCNEVIDIYNISQAGAAITDDVYQSMVENECLVDEYTKSGRNNVYKSVTIEKILQSGGDVNFTVPVDDKIQSNSKIFGYTALHFAVKFRSISAIKVLLNHQADINIKDHNGYTPLHLAVKKSYGKKVNCLEFQGTLKHPFADLVLNVHSEKAISSNPACKDGISHFHIACMLNITKAVKYFVQSGTPLNEQVSNSSSFLPGFTPLHFAARYCSLEVAKILLNHGADRYVVDSKGMTPVHILLKYKIEIVDGKNMANLKKFPNFDVELDRVEQMIAILIDDSSKNVSPIDGIGLTYLHVICTQASFATDENIKSHLGNVINAVVKPDSSDWPGYTPLHFAAHFNLETVLYLVKNKANILAKDVHGVTPLDLCVERYEAKDLVTIFKEDKTLSRIRFTDNSKLMDIVSLLAFPKKLSDFVNSKNIHISISLDSPLWPGYSLMHVAVLFTKFSKDFIISDLLSKNDQTDTDDFSKIDESALDNQVNMANIALCLSKYISSPDNKILQAADGMTPIHLAFKLKNYSACKILSDGLKEEFNYVDNQNLSHFHIACIQNCEEAVEKFLNVKNKKTVKFIKMINSPIRSSIEWYRPYGRKLVKVTAAAESTPLHFAVMTNNKELTGLLLKMGADPCIKNEDGLTAVHISFLQSKFMLDTLLYTAARKLENPETREGFSHFHIACCSGNTQIVQSFLNLGVDVNKAIARKPLAYTNVENISKVREKFQIYREGSDLSKMLNSFYLGFTPLHFALEKGIFAIVKLLVENGADLFSKSDKELTPLYLACTGQSIKIQYYFLLKIMNREVKFVNVAGFNLLHMACFMAEENLIKKLLKSGYDVNARINSEHSYQKGFTPLHCLIFSSRTTHCTDLEKIVRLYKLLIEYGADLTIVTPRRGSPVHYSTKNNSILMFLKSQKNFKINPIDENGKSHFHIACSRNCPAIVRKFLKGGIEIDKTNNCFEDDKYTSGLTPLHFAMEKDASIEVVRLLIKNGANVNAKDSSGSTPLHLAKKLNKVESILNTGKVDVTAKNIYGETPFECILSGVRGSKEKMKIVELMVSLGIRTTTYNPLSGRGFLATCLPRVLADNVEKIIDTATDINDFDEEENRNAIQNIVSIENAQSSYERYSRFIRQLMSKGCDVNHQDSKGKTALHTAVQFNNGPAAKTLLIVGADVNVEDEDGKSAFRYCMESTKSSDYLKKLFQWYVNDLVTYNLYLSESNRLLYNTVPPIHQSSHSDEYRVDYEDEIEEITIFTLTESLKVYDLLSADFIAKYPRMLKVERKAIDDFFKIEIIYSEFPFLCHLLNYQYISAMNRLSLIESAKDVLRFLSGLNVPVLCMDVIFKHLSNNDLRNMILLNVDKLKSSERTVNDEKLSKLECKIVLKRCKVE